MPLRPPPPSRPEWGQPNKTIWTSTGDYIDVFDKGQYRSDVEEYEAELWAEKFIEEDLYGWYSEDEEENKTKKLSKIKKVFVLLINPRSQNECIYTIQHDDNINEVLMFANRRDAENYKKLLIKQNFIGFSVELISRIKLEETCQYHGYLLRLIEKGERVVPPQTNTENFNKYKF